MTRPFWPVRFFALWAVCVLLMGTGAGLAHADGLALSAVFGIAGHYRPGTWCPVTVTVQNPGLETLSGQVQALAAGDPGRANGGPGSNTALATALFARPVSVNGSGSQSFVVYTRGIDPGRDTVTVQLAEGRERGNGRILAETNNQPNNGTPTVTGNPVGENDLFLVGFGGDPGAFTYLSGQKLGLAHQTGGPVTSSAVWLNQNGGSNPLTTATAQVAEAVAADLPDKAAGYSGVDAVLLRSDAPLDTLTEAQTDALRGWVAAGGHLIVCGGVDASRFGSSFFTGLLPADIGPVKPSVTLPGVGAVGALTLTPKPLPGVRVLAGSAQTGPLIVSGPFGAGCVTLTAYDPTTKPFQNPAFAAPALWQTLLGAGSGLPSSVLSHVAAREENSSPGYYYGGNDQTLLSDAVMRAPSLDAPGTEVIGLFLLVYLIVLVPVNYLVLKRLDRKEMAWVTIPVLVLIFAVGTFGVGYAAKGGAVFVNRVAILETSAGQRQAGVYTELGLFSPHRTAYDIALPGANALAAIPNPGFNPYGRRSNDSETQSYGQTRFVETGDGASLQDTAVNMWAMRAFDAQSTTELGGTVDAALSEKPGPPLPPHLTSWGITGTVTNHTPFDLSECALVYHGQWQQLGTLAHGVSLPVAINTPTGSNNPQAGLQIPTLLGRVDKNDPQSDISQRMRAALADYTRSLGQQNNNGYYYNGGQAQPPAAFAPSSGEAILVGWSNDPALSGPAPRVDGHSVKENDVTLVVIHLPVAPQRVVE